jgi:hypothetical protein
VNPEELDRILTLLAGWKPGSLLVAGADLPADGLPAAVVTRLDPTTGTDALADLGRFDAAVVAFSGDTPDPDELELFLGRLKNLHAPRIAVRTDSPEGTAIRLRALAFEPDTAQGTVWVHDIDRYNPHREWNTARDWAHPENFDKYRW